MAIASPHLSPPSVQAVPCGELAGHCVTRHTGTRALPPDCACPGVGCAALPGGGQAPLCSRCAALQLCLGTGREGRRPSSEACQSAAARASPAQDCGLSPPGVPPPCTSARGQEGRAPAEPLGGRGRRGSCPGCAGSSFPSPKCCAKRPVDLLMHQRSAEAHRPQAPDAEPEGARPDLSRGGSASSFATELQGAAGQTRA